MAELLEGYATDRRKFLEFMGASTVLSQAALGGIVSEAIAGEKTIGFTPLAATDADDFVVASGFRSKPLISWEDQINATEKFGFNNDFVAFVPNNKGLKDQALLFVNHESPDPLFVSGWTGKNVRTKKQVELERHSVGASIIALKKDVKGAWIFDPKSSYNRRLDASTRIPFAGGQKVMGSSEAIGTFANCSGGMTPWGTVLTCEENYQDYYGEAYYDSKGKRKVVEGRRTLGWSKYFTSPPEHYGWVVEVDPWTGKAKKHVAMGRFAHEGAAVTRAKDGRIVVYMGDDAVDRCFYKFVSESNDSLERGTLYVANISQGKWHALDLKAQPILRKHFKTQTEVMIRTREAGRLLGGSAMDRPEAAAVDPRTGHIYLALTNNKNRGNYFGYIARFAEDHDDAASMTFRHSTFVAGGPKSGLACPDNLTFDDRGNLWITTDVSGGSLGKTPYAWFGNNSLFVAPLRGKDAGKVLRVASAPNGAELTGPAFSEDGNTLFLSVQHPGDGTKDLTKPKSKWATKGDGIPRPAVVAITGEVLNHL